MKITHDRFQAILIGGISWPLVLVMKVKSRGLRRCALLVAFPLLVVNSMLLGFPLALLLLGSMLLELIDDDAS